MTDSPEGWVEVELRDLFEFKYGKGLPQDKRNTEGSIPVFGSNGIIGKHDKAISRGQTIIVGRKGSVGEINFSDVECWPIDTTYYIDEFHGDLPPRYWALFFKSLQLGNHEKSSAIPGISRDDIYRISVSLPPAREQRRILAKLEALLSKIESCQERIARIPELLERFRQSVLAAACSGQLTAVWRDRHSLANRDVDEPWAKARLTSICEKVIDCPHSTPKWTTSGEVCLRTTNFSRRGLDLSEVRYVSHEGYQQRTARLEPQGGDIVYSREGGILGIACVIPEGLRVCLGQRMMLMRCDRDIMRPNFLCSVLNSPATRARVTELAGGTASPNLNVGDIKEFVVPTPSLDEQDEVLRCLDALFTFADSIETRYECAKTHVNKLTQAILAEAFSGELVPTEAELARRDGREYESASVLLERIQRERGQQAVEKKPRAKHAARRAKPTSVPEPKQTRTRTARASTTPTLFDLTDD